MAQAIIKAQSAQFVCPVTMVTVVISEQAIKPTCFSDIKRIDEWDYNYEPQFLTGSNFCSLALGRELCNAHFKFAASGRHLPYLGKVRAAASVQVHSQRILATSNMWSPLPQLHLLPCLTPLPSPSFSKQRPISILYFLIHSHKNIKEFCLLMHPIPSQGQE